MTPQFFSGNKAILVFAFEFLPLMLKGKIYMMELLLNLIEHQSGLRKYNQEEFVEYVFNRTKTFSMKEAINTILYTALREQERPTN